tara:strand:- start:2027 stop:2854 length:828 start_codon:yes stop_codon:yes gene_type:complete
MDFLSKDLAPATIKQYKRQFQKLTDLLENTIVDSSQKTIITTIKRENLNVNSSFALLNIAIIIFRHSGKNLEKLVHYRDVLKGKVLEHTINVNSELVLPSSKTIETYIKSLYNRKLWRDYIINYLVWTYNTRNELDIKFVNSTRIADKDQRHNYLVIRAKHIIFIKNKYKTSKVYGRREFINTNPDFRRAVLALSKSQEHLIIDKNDEPISDENIGTYVLNATYEKLGEGKYLKIQLDEAKKKKNTFNIIKKISKRRGTDLETLLTAYNIEDEST